MENNLIKIDHHALEVLAKLDENSSLTPFSREIFLQGITISGTMFCDTIDVIAPEIEKQPDLSLKLLRQPNNKYDKYAIAAYYRETQVGWVPMEYNRVFARLMDAGKTIACKVLKTEWEDNRFKIDAKLFLVD